MSSDRVEGRPNRPHARLVRQTLKRAGLGDAVQKVSTGRRRCWVRLKWDREGDTDAVIEALCPLWSDGRSRVRKIVDGTVVIDVPGWHSTHPTQKSD